MSEAKGLGRYRNWCFTLNNPKTPFDVDSNEFTCDLEQWHPNNCSYIVCQLEMGEQSTPHLQGYLELDRAVRLSTIRKWAPSAHFEPRYGTQAQAIEYAKKAETRTAGPWEWGVAKNQGQRTDLAELVDQVKSGVSTLDIVSSNPSSLRFISHIERLRSFVSPRKRKIPRIAWLSGETGTGKTKTAWEVFGFNAYLFTENPGGVQWWQGYKGEQRCILDEFGGDYPFKQFLQVLDLHPFRVQVKGGSATLEASDFIITSNLDPAAFYVTVGHYNALRRRLEEWALLAEFQRERVGGGVTVRWSQPEHHRDGIGRTEPQEESLEQFLLTIKNFFEDLLCVSIPVSGYQMSHRQIRA